MKRVFELEYLDWCKEKKNVNSIEETYRADWVSEFYHSKEWNEKPINGIQFGIATGIIK